MANDDVTKDPNAATEPAPAEQTASVPEPPAPPAEVAPGVALPGSVPIAADPVYTAQVAYDPQPLAGQQDTSRNWMGVVALVFGILGGVLLALIFGILGLNAVKQGKANNRGMALWGIILAGIWTLLVLLGIGLLVAFSDSTNSAANAEVGDCYVSTVSSEALTYVDPDFGACTDETNAEVYYVTTFDGLSTPDDETFTDELFAQCTADASIANVDADLAAEYYVEYYVPYADSWATDPHTIVCGLSTDGGPVDPAAIQE